ncbi:MAG: CHAD domain-containing protein, partial [Solirubrobacteraceae bacterium]
MAASVAVGVGMKMTRLARERRIERERQLGLLPGEPLGGALQRMAVGQLDLALAMLDSAGQEPDERAIHETRKALKRLRALLRLLQPELGLAAYEHENAALRDAGRRLAGARDAEVTLATLDALIERHPRKLLGRRSIIRLRATLLSERERARTQTLGDAGARAHVVAELNASRARVQAWRLPDSGQLKLV